jgi:hypothetical protein
MIEPSNCIWRPYGRSKKVDTQDLHAAPDAARKQADADESRDPVGAQAG